MATAQSAAPQFNNLNATDIANIAQDFASNFVPTNVSSAAAMPKLLGLRVGILGGTTATSSIESLTDGGVEKTPVLGLYLRLGLPEGFGVDYTTLPLKIAGITYRYTTLGLLWTLPNEKIPFTTQLKINFTKAKLTWALEDSTNTVVSYDHLGVNFSLVVSKRFQFVEPYFGVGLVSGSNDINASAEASVFDTTVTLDQRESIHTSDVHYFFGIDADLVWVQLGIELANNFGNKQMTARFAVDF